MYKEEPLNYEDHSNKFYDPLNQMQGTDKTPKETVHSKHWPSFLLYQYFLPVEATRQLIIHPELGICSMHIDDCSTFSFKADIHQVQE